MTGPSHPAIDSTLSDTLLGARPVWGAFIGGGFVDSTGSDTFEVLEAANGRVLASVVDADDALVDAAVLDARRAYESVWRDGRRARRRRPGRRRRRR